MTKNPIRTRRNSVYFLRDIAVIGVIGPVSVSGCADIGNGCAGSGKRALEEATIGVSGAFVEAVGYAIAEGEDAEGG